MYEDLLEEFDELVKMVEVTLEAMVRNEAVTLSNLLTATERELLPNLYSV